MPLTSLHFATTLLLRRLLFFFKLGGVFSTQVGRYISEGHALPILFNQNNMNYFRHLMALGICKAEEEDNFTAALLLKDERQDADAPAVSSLVSIRDEDVNINVNVGSQRTIAQLRVLDERNGVNDSDDREDNSEDDSEDHSKGSEDDSEDSDDSSTEPEEMHQRFASGKKKGQCRKNCTGCASRSDESDESDESDDASNASDDYQSKGMFQILQNENVVIVSQLFVGKVLLSLWTIIIEHILTFHSLI